MRADTERVIGVLALQGAVSEHAAVLKKLGESVRSVTTPEDLNGLAGIVLPGGESTAIRKLLVREKMLEPLKELIGTGLPVLGTCAGMVLLAQPESLGALGASVERNGFGRQRESFEAPVRVKGLENSFTGVFIRAPYYRQVAADVEILATLDGGSGREEGRIVAARKDAVLVCSFHPELTDDTRLHELFLRMIEKSEYAHGGTHASVHGGRT